MLFRFTKEALASFVFVYMVYNRIMLSVIIPSRNEKFLNKTVEDILSKARGEIEVITILDGYWDIPIADPRVRAIHKGQSEGMRAGINSGVAIARGEYILKCDGHVMFDEGFDVKLIEVSKDMPNAVIIPRRKRLDAVNWCIKDVGKIDVDYEFLSYPDDPKDWGGKGLNGKIWEERALERADIMIDDTPASQGSCWMMHKKYFHEIGLMDDKKWGTFWCESQEIALKAVLSGGRYVTYKGTWYAHLHKGKEHGRGYTLDHNLLIQGRNQTIKYFEGHRVTRNQKYPLSYMIEKFMPMPTWDDEKLTQLKEREAKNWK